MPGSVSLLPVQDPSVLPQLEVGHALEVVIESGPVSYAEEEEVETDQYLDEDVEEDVPAEGYYADIAYPGDPLLLSDGEDGAYARTCNS